MDRQSTGSQGQSSQARGSDPITKHRGEISISLDSDLSRMVGSSPSVVARAISTGTTTVKAARRRLLLTVPAYWHSVWATKDLAFSGSSGSVSATKATNLGNR